MRRDFEAVERLVRRQLFLDGRKINLERGAVADFAVDPDMPATCLTMP